MRTVTLLTTHGLTVVFDSPASVTVGKRIAVSGFTTATFTRDGKSSTLDLTHDKPEFSIAQRYVRSLQVDFQ